jgi:hypothetical protein
LEFVFAPAYPIVPCFQNKREIAVDCLVDSFDIVLINDKIPYPIAVDSDPVYFPRLVARVDCFCMDDLGEIPRFSLVGISELLGTGNPDDITTKEKSYDKF